jgi:hypothetical protein
MAISREYRPSVGTMREMCSLGNGGLDGHYVCGELPAPLKIRSRDSWFGTKQLK